MYIFVRIFVILGYITVLSQAVRRTPVPSFLEVSKVVYIEKDEDCYTVQCPIIPVNRSQHNVRISNFNVIWILHTAHVVIGGGSKEIVSIYKNYNHDKYIFMPDTGDLQINNISSNDLGVYRCIVELVALTENGSSSRYFYETAAVELASDYGNQPPTEFTGDIARALITASGTLLLLSVACIVYSYRWRDPKSTTLQKGGRSSYRGHGGSGESYQNWEASFEESKSSSDRDNVTYNVSDSDVAENTLKMSEKLANIPPPSTGSTSDNKIFIISCSDQATQETPTPLLLSPACPPRDAQATVIPPPETSPTFPPSMLMMRKKVEEEKQDGIRIPATGGTTTTGTTTSPNVVDHYFASSGGGGAAATGTVPLFQFESTTCSTVTGSSDACQRKLTKQQWLWNWTNSNNSSETSITNKDSIAVTTMQKPVTTPVITSPASEYSTISTVSSSVARENSAQSFTVPIEMQSSL